MSRFSRDLAAVEAATDVANLRPVVDRLDRYVRSEAAANPFSGWADLMRDTGDLRDGVRFGVPLEESKLLARATLTLVEAAVQRRRSQVLLVLALASAVLFAIWLTLPSISGPFRFGSAVVAVASGYLSLRAARRSDELSVSR